MKASEGKLGRAFLIRLEPGDTPDKAIEDFAREKGIGAGQVFFIGREAATGIMVPDSEGVARLRLPATVTITDPVWQDCEVMIQEVVGVSVRLIVDPVSGKESLSRIVSAKTRVMEKPAPAPEESGPGTVPVYLFNADMN